MISFLYLRNLDPFLLLDEFEGAGEEGAGFPDHPHRYEGIFQGGSILTVNHIRDSTTTV